MTHHHSKLYKQLLLVVVIIFSCFNARADQPVDVSQDAPTPGDELPLPSVPNDLRQPSERASYIITHFWDALPASDSPNPYSKTEIGGYTREAVEQAFANFISVFPYATPEARVQAVKTFLAKAGDNSEAYSILVRIAEIYLFDLESPVASDEYYTLFLNEIINSDILDFASKMRPRWQLDAVTRNRVGSPAADFTFQLADGNQSSLRSHINQLTEPDARLLLIFYDPDCDHCRMIMDSIKANPSIAADIEVGRLSVVAVYSGDDRDLWNETVDSIPASWTVGYDDGTLQEDGTYILRTLPTLYLIDAKGIVLQKDKVDL